MNTDQKPEALVDPELELQVHRRFPAGGYPERSNHIAVRYRGRSSWFACVRSYLKRRRFTIRRIRTHNRAEFDVPILNTQFLRPGLYAGPIASRL